MLHCTFDHGVCDWMSDREGDLHWETTHNPAGNKHTHTLNSKMCFKYSCIINILINKYYMMMLLSTDIRTFKVFFNVQHLSIVRHYR